MNHRRWRFAVVWILLLLLAGIPVLAQTGDIAIIGRDFVLERGERAEGDVVVFGGSAEIADDAVVSGDMAIVGGSARIDGTVEGDLVILGGRTVLGQNALIRGDVIAMGELSQAAGARIEGGIVSGAEASQRLGHLPNWLGFPFWTIPGLQHPPRLSLLLGVMRWAATLIGLLMIAAVIVLILPEPIRHISSIMGRSVLLCIGIGVLTLIVVSVLVPILMITLIGIPVAIVLVVALALAGLVGWVAAGQLVGHHILRGANVASPTQILEVVTGVFLIALVSRVPCLGFLFVLGAICWGLGAVVLTRFGTSPYLIWSPFAPLAGTVGLSETNGTMASSVGSEANQKDVPSDTPLKEAPESDTRRLDDAPPTDKG